MTVRLRHWIPILGLAALIGTAPAHGDGQDPGPRPPAAALGQPDRIPISRRSAERDPREGSVPAASTGWWFGTGGIVLALAIFGAISVASRRYLPGVGGEGMQVIGRTSLSSRQSAVLLKVGSQVFVVGVGPQGAPSLLGEIQDPEELRGFQPRRGAATVHVNAATGSHPKLNSRRVEPVSAQASRPGGFDLRIGDDE